VPLYRLFFTYSVFILVCVSGSLGLGTDLLGKSGMRWLNASLVLHITATSTA